MFYSPASNFKNKMISKKAMFHPIIWVIIIIGLIASLIEIGRFMGWINSI